MTVREIQHALNSVGSSLPRLVEDGVWGVKTRERVLEFQRLNRLPETGVVDDSSAPQLAFLSGQSSIGFPDIPISSRGPGDPAAGTPHPEYPGCFWDPSIRNYACDDGFTVDGQSLAGGGYDDGTSATGSPFNPVTRGGTPNKSQSNNNYVVIALAALALIALMGGRR